MCLTNKRPRLCSRNFVLKLPPYVQASLKIIFLFNLCLNSPSKVKKVSFLEKEMEERRYGMQIHADCEKLKVSAFLSETYFELHLVRRIWVTGVPLHSLLPTWRSRLRFFFTPRRRSGFDTCTSIAVIHLPPIRKGLINDLSWVESQRYRTRISGPVSETDSVPTAPHCQFLFWRLSLKG